MSEIHIHAFLVLATTSFGIVACATSDTRSNDDHLSNLPPGNEVICYTERQLGSHVPKRVCRKPGTVAVNQPIWVIGSMNKHIAEGGRALRAGENEEGIKLTLLGLQLANGKREEEVALSNLCAGYTNLGDYETALKYCDILLQRNDKMWRAYNSKALIYIYTKQYEKAEQELIKGEALNPDARTMKVARALYLDATNPVAPEIEIDDRQIDNQ